MCFLAAVYCSKAASRLRKYRVKLFFFPFCNNNVIGKEAREETKEKRGKEGDS